MKKVMSAHQPNFLPYLGFFDKMRKSDIFVIRDECQFVERDWHHRNSIRINGEDSNGNPQSKWLTVPVEKKSEPINSIIIKNDVKQKNVPWNFYMLRQIKSTYETTLFFKEYFPRLEKIFMSRHEKLIDLNMEIINFLKNCFDIKTEIVLASKLNCYERNGDASRNIANIAMAVNSDIYLSGPKGKTYLNRDLFEKNKIEVVYQEFHHPVYPQRFLGFVPNMASIDALFNVGNIFNTKYNKDNEQESNGQQEPNENNKPDLVSVVNQSGV